jgi:septum formation inhibitor MinC
MTSQLADGTKLKKLDNEKQALTQKLEEAKNVIQEKEVLINTTQRETRIAQDSVARTKIMAELLQPLSKKQKKIMSDLLEGTKTEKLTESFKKYVPTILSEKIVSTRKQPLTENKSIVTGDKTVTEAGNSADGADIINLRKLAGLT